MSDTEYSQDSVCDYVCRLIQKKSRFPDDCVIDELDYLETGYIDSMALIKFVLDIESKFDIEISEFDMLSPQFRTVGGLVRLIGEKLGAR